MNTNRPKTDIDILTEQLRVLYGHFSFMSWANLPTVIVFAYIIYDDIHPAIVLTWAGSILLSISCRTYLAQKFKRLNPKGDAIYRWAKMAVASALASGVLWGVLVYLSTYGGDFDFQITCVFMCAMASIFLAPGSTYRPAFFAFVIPIFISITICSTFQLVAYWYVSLLYVMGLLILINLSGHYAKTFIESIHIRFENQELIEQLTTKNDQINALLDKKNSLFSNVSHEFRTPLTLILGPTESLLTKVENKEVKDSLQIIKRNAQRLSGLVEQLFTFSRLSFGDQLERKAISVDKTIDHIQALLASAFQEKRQTLVVPPDSGLWLELRPENALEMIVANLLSNAIKYTPEGSRIEVEIKRHDEAWITIAVSDNGKGIPMNEQSRIFNRFARLAEHQESGIPGTGLGLALVKELVDMNNGTVQVSNNSDGGARFEVRLPCSNSPEILEDEQQSYLTKAIVQQTSQEWLLDEAGGQGKDVPGATILLIDDTPDIGRFIQSELQDEYHVLIAQNGEDGLEQLKQSNPDLVICDVMMPGIDGFEVLQRIRENVEISHTPIIMLTARFDKESRIKSYHYQADDYITKPFEMDTLKARIKGLIEIRRALKLKASSVLAKTDTENISKLSIYDEKEDDFLKKFHAMIDENYCDCHFQIEHMSQIMGLSASPLGKKVKALLGNSPYQYLRLYRLEKAATKLKDGFDGSMGQLAEQIGFASQQHFTNSFKEFYGVSPKQFSQS